MIVLWFSPVYKHTLTCISVHKIKKFWIHTLQSKYLLHQLISCFNNPHIKIFLMFTAIWKNLTLWEWEISHRIPQEQNARLAYYWGHSSIGEWKVSNRQLSLRLTKTKYSHLFLTKKPNRTFKRWWCTTVSVNKFWSRVELI